MALIRALAPDRRFPVRSAAEHQLGKLGARAVPLLAPLVARTRRLFDLDADPVEIGKQLGRDRRLARLVRRRPGLRYTPPEQQVAVKRDERLRVVKMDAEERK